MANKSKLTAYQRRLEQEREVKKQKDNAKIDIVSQVFHKVIPRNVAAQFLNVSLRQVDRLVESYREQVPDSVLHQGRNKPSNHRSNDAFHEEVIGLIKEKYQDSGPTLISDELSELNGIEVNKETIQRWMVSEGLWTVNAPSKSGHRRWRERKANVGQLVQMDTSVHNWFGPDRPKVYCIAMIDDASSRLFAGFYEADSTLTNKDLIKRYINQYGRPLALYTDKASHFIETTSTPLSKALQGMLRAP